MLRRGGIVDATLVRSAASTRNRHRDGTVVDRGADCAARSERDPRLGYKLHAAADEDTGVMRQIAPTPASRHEPRDRARPRRGGLRTWQRAASFVVETVRPRIEPVSGTLKRCYGLARARCFSLARNLVDTTFRVPAFDLRRAVGLAPPAT